LELNENATKAVTYLGEFFFNLTFVFSTYWLFRGVSLWHFYTCLQCILVRSAPTINQGEIYNSKCLYQKYSSRRTMALTPANDYVELKRDSFKSLFHSSHALPHLPVDYTRYFSLDPEDRMLIASYSEVVLHAQEELEGIGKYLSLCSKGLKFQEVKFHYSCM
jgi:hypothetical protein